LNDGSVKWVLGRAVPEIDKQNNIIGYVGTITDITNIKLYQQEQTRLKEKAEESNRLKSAFLANMSHEIRTPMNGILGFASLLKNSNLSEQKHDNYIKIIEKSGTRMLNIINDIISISKIESGTMSVHKEEVNLNEQMDYAFTFFKPEVEFKGMTFSMNNSLLSSDISLETDKDKFLSVLTNLIKNAIKYSDQGSIDFGCHLKENKIEFYVKDTGIGIPEERQKAVFERFVQADIEDTMAREGAGLGLAISRAYIKLLQGEIWLESEEGVGSTFYFSIPHNQADIIEVATPIEKTNKKPNTQVKQLKILLVEDDKLSKYLIEILLREIDCTLIYATNGIEAIEACRANDNLDLVLMDIRMPEMGGYEATRKIREFNKDIIIIAQTAHALKGDAEKSIEAGCNEYISKPIDKVELFGIIHSYFGK